jgi:UDP-N-acetylmuramoyl-L-alanyl-D-glutamate--2,6-diaminopimelate ligase
MGFNAVMQGVTARKVHSSDVLVTGVEYDSRRVVAGSLFVAMRGESTDGNKYIATALKQGAVAVVADTQEIYERLATEHADLGLAFVEHGRRALAEVSANFFQHPERTLKLCGVTGTNGKTTTAFLLEGLLQSVQRKSVLLGTIETHIAGEVRPSPHTTPESRDVLEIFAEGVRAGATEAVMEMSSHALAQERVWALPVDVAIFTNLTQDHLDYHVTMEEYARAKARIFEGVGANAPRVAVINADDAYAPQMTDAASGCEIVWTYSTQNSSADFSATDISLGIGSTSFDLKTPQGSVRIHSRLTGLVNVYNLIAAIAAAMARGLTLQECATGAAGLTPVPGRFETVPNNLGLAVVVDYAHTDDALTNLIALARHIAGDCRVITMFGCGGDRDKTKRPKMGRAAGLGSDYVIVTSDNPRSEDPAAIAEEVVRGILDTDVEYEVVLDRRSAIARAIELASVGDIVLLAGKGHEKVQIAREGTVPFDDVAVAAEIMNTMRFGSGST